MCCRENKQVLIKYRLLCIYSYLKTLVQGHRQQMDSFFLSVYSNTYPLSNSFQIVMAIKPKFKTIADV